MAEDKVGQVAKWLVIIGGLNLGIAGVTGLIGNATDVIGLAGATVANIIFLLIGLSALWQLKGVVSK